MPMILPLGKLRQEDSPEFKASLGYIHLAIRLLANCAVSWEPRNQVQSIATKEDNGEKKNEPRLLPVLP